jgi:hypothetical protein
MEVINLISKKLKKFAHKKYEDNFLSVDHNQIVEYQRKRK